MDHYNSEHSIVDYNTIMTSAVNVLTGSNSQSCCTWYWYCHSHVHRRQVTHYKPTSKSVSQAATIEVPSSTIYG